MRLLPTLASWRRATGRFRQRLMSRLESVQEIYACHSDVPSSLLSLRFRLIAPRLVTWVCMHRNSLRCLFVLRSGEPEETRGVTNVAHYSETALVQRVPTQFPRFQITFRCLFFPFALKFATLRQRSPVSSSRTCRTAAHVYVYVYMCL